MPRQYFDPVYEDEQYENLKEPTKCIVAGYDASQHGHAANPPIYLTSTFEFDTAEACAAAFAGTNQQMIYSRLGNPTQDIVEKRIAVLEHTESCAVTASGMGAITSTLWTFLNAGDVLIASNRIYGCTFAYMKHTLTRFGVIVEFVDMTNVQQVEQVASKYDNIAMIYTESIQNPSNDVVDLDKIARIAHSHDALFVVDNTFASPLGCNPCKFGADLIIHSATKYLLGGIYTAGAVCGPREYISRIKLVGLKDCTGAVLSADLCFAMYEMIETLDIRYRKMSENATKVAAYLEQHPKVERVVCTGLESHPQHQLCEKYLKIANPLFTLYLKGDYEQCTQMMNNLKLCLRAVSLGKTHTLIDHPASMTHSTYTYEEREEYGITDNMIRVSIGLEDADDIIADFAQALSHVEIEN